MPPRKRPEHLEQVAASLETALESDGWLTRVDPLELAEDLLEELRSYGLTVAGVWELREERSGGDPGPAERR